MFSMCLFFLSSPALPFSHHPGSNSGLATIMQVSVHTTFPNKLDTTWMLDNNNNVYAPFDRTVK